jgi:hypothetical protein
MCCPVDKKITYGEIMRYTISFLLLIILLFTFSCKGRKSGLKGVAVNHVDVSEANENEQQKSAPLSNESQNYIPGLILIKFKDGTDAQRIETIQKSLGLTTIRVIPELKIHYMKIQNGSSVEEVMKRLKEFSAVDYSEPNYIFDFQ